MRSGTDSPVTETPFETHTPPVGRAVPVPSLTIRTKSAQLKSKNGEVLPITPGMVASVEVKTGTKTVLDYILKPVLKMNEAFRER